MPINEYIQVSELAKKLGMPWQKVVLNITYNLQEGVDYKKKGSWMKRIINIKENNLSIN
jgi:hypothetical protein